MTLVNLGGINNNPSTVDWHGECCITVFFRGCILHCKDCHNASIRDGSTPVEIYDIAKKISKNKELISGVVITGGECTFQPDALEELAMEIKNMGKLVGVQTAGVFPNVLERMFKNSLIDKVFLDVKSELRYDKYLAAVGVPLKFSQYSDIHSRVLQSLVLCDTMAPDLEIRTTVFPDGPSLESLEHILISLENNISRPTTWRLQPGITMEESDKPRNVRLLAQKKNLVKISKSLESWINIKNIQITV